MASVGLIGLGTMGSRMVRRQLAGGVVPIVYDLVPAAREAMVALGASAAASIADLVARADVVLTSLPMPADLEAVVGEALPSARPGQVFADLSTIDPATARRVAARLADRGARFLDAPVSGGPWGVEAGTLTVMAGGDADALDLVRPALAPFAGRVFKVGPVGAGSVVKLANQLLAAAHTIAGFEALHFAQQAGIDPAVAVEVISVSTGDSAMLRRDKQFVENHDFAAAFALRLMAKDLRLYAGEASQLGTATPIGAPTVATYEQAMARGWGGDDYAAVLRLVEERS